MRHRLVTFLALLALFGTGLATPSVAGSAPPGPGTRPPNILLITTDDQRADDMQHMPFTQSLIGDQGVTFTDAIAPYPLCCPARATILTGMFNHNNGVLTNGAPYGGYQALRDGPYADKTLPVWLKSVPGVDYRTSFIGKMMNGYGQDDPYAMPAGWDYFAAGVRGMYDYYGRTLNIDGTLEDASGKYQTDHNQELSEVQMQEAHQAGRPFFIWQSELAPHGACWPAEDGATCTWGPPMAAQVDEQGFADLPLVSLGDPAFNERAIADKPDYITARTRFGSARIDLLTEAHRARVRSLQAVDRNVRDTVELLGSLRRADGTSELDNTLIIFTSDNGFLLGEHRQSGKILPYEQSLGVPLLMRGPDLPQGVRISETVALVDIAATIADAAGVQPLLPQDGRSLLPIGRGEALGWGAIPIEAGVGVPTAPDQWFYRGVRTDRWVFLEYEQTGEFELYDRLQDPHQLDNLAYRATHAAVRSALQSKLTVLRTCEAAECRSESADGVPSPTSDGTPIHPDELATVHSATQVVTVTGARWDGSRGKLVAWRKIGRSWRVSRGPIPVKLGRNGFSGPRQVRHLRSKTPAGTFTISNAMGFKPDPGTDLRYRRLDSNDYLPHDRTQPVTYNVFQPYRSRKARWSLTAAEQWARNRDRYPYALVLDYNMPRRVVRHRRFDELVAREPADIGKGSFVVHVGDRVGRHGWVSMSAADMRWLLRWVNPGSTPTFVVGTPRFLRDRL